MEIKTLKQLIKYCKKNERICPQPQMWNSLWGKFGYKKRVGAAGWEPPLPLILAAWWDASANSTQFRFVQHLSQTPKRLDKIHLVQIAKTCPKAYFGLTYQEINTSNINSHATI